MFFIVLDGRLVVPAVKQGKVIIALLLRCCCSLLLPSRSIMLPPCYAAAMPRWQGWSAAGSVLPVTTITTKAGTITGRGSLLNGDEHDETMMTMVDRRANGGGQSSSSDIIPDARRLSTAHENYGMIDDRIERDEAAAAGIRTTSFFPAGQYRRRFRQAVYFCEQVVGNHYTVHLLLRCLFVGRGESTGIGMISTWCRMVCLKEPSRELSWERWLRISVWGFLPAKSRRNGASHQARVSSPWASYPILQCCGAPSSLSWTTPRVIITCSYGQIPSQKLLSTAVEARPRRRAVLRSTHIPHVLVM